jgi:hypothetical protein
MRAMQILVQTRFRKRRNEIRFGGVEQTLECPLFATGN